LYNHHNYPSPQRQLGTSQLHGIGVPSSGIKTDVSLNTLRTESGLVGSLSYYRDAIPEDCAQALLVSFKQALDELLAIPPDVLVNDSTEFNQEGTANQATGLQQ
jgi:hypothetical protein